MNGWRAVKWTPVSRRVFAGVRALVVLSLALLVGACEVEHQSDVVIDWGEPCSVTAERRHVELYFWVTGPDGQPMGDVRVTWEDLFYAHHGEAGVTSFHAYHGDDFLVDQPVNLYPPVVLDAPVGTELMFRFQKPGYLDAWMVFPVPPPDCHLGGPLVLFQVVRMEPLAW